MTMHFRGLAPTAPLGRSFNESNWGWFPLWAYCADLVPELLPDPDRDRFNAADADRLAAALTAALETGAAADSVADFLHWRESLPRTPCPHCGGTVGTAPAACCHCDGVGSVPHLSSYYRLSIDGIARFRDFLSACGGFELDG